MTELVTFEFNPGTTAIFILKLLPSFLLSFFPHSNRQKVTDPIYKKKPLGASFMNIPTAGNSFP